MASTAPEPFRINNIKEIQSQLFNIVSLINHKRNWTVNYPKYYKPFYQAGDELTFDLKPSLVDYINFDLAYITCDVNVDNIVIRHFMYGTVGLIGRCYFLINIYPIWDIQQYGRNKWMELQGVVDKNKQNWETMYSSTSHPNQRTAIAQGESVRIKIPIMTPFDNVYFPVVNISEQLTLKIELAQDIDCITYNDEDATETFPYQLSNVQLWMDGLTALSGADLDNKEFVYHITIPKYFLNRCEVGESYWQFMYEMKNASLKKMISGLFRIADLPKHHLEFYSAHHEDVVKYQVSISGTVYPFAQGLSGDLDLWFEFERWFGRYDNFYDPKTYEINYNEGFNTHSLDAYWYYASPNVIWVRSDSDDWLLCFFLCMTFDTLGQTSSIMSGVNNETYTLIQLLQILTPLEHAYLLMNWIYKDAVLQVLNGTVIVND